MFWCLLGLADGDPATPCDYFEYSSTISASLMSVGRSPRSGTALNTPLNLFESTSTHDGDRSIVEDTVSASFRSEEHTSELQSLMRISYAVFCLKKKTYTTT